MAKKPRSENLGSESTLVQEVFAAALDWIDALEQLDEKNIKLSDEKTAELLAKNFFKGDNDVEK